MRAYAGLQSNARKARAPEVAEFMANAFGEARAHPFVQNVPSTVDDAHACGLDTEIDAGP